MDLINWKTTAAGAAIVVAWIVKLVFKVDCPDEVMTGLTAILTGLGFLFAKDRNVTGGTVMQPTSPAVNAEKKEEERKQ